MRYAFLGTFIGEYSVRLMCLVLQLTPSGYYAWRKRPWIERRLADELLALHIMDVFLRSHETYGSPRVHADLQAAGIRVSKKRVARVMKEHDLVARRPGRRVSTTDSNHAEPIAPNVVAREFAVAANPTVDRVWLGDITYVPTATGWLYRPWSSISLRGGASGGPCGTRWRPTWWTARCRWRWRPGSRPPD